MNKRIIKLKHLVIPYCEGEAEMMIFSFLKLNFSNKNITFGSPVNMKGFSSFALFERKFNKCCKARSFKPAEEYSNVELLFILDDDLKDSSKIKIFLDGKGHLTEQLQPNIEGVLLNIIGKNQGHNLRTEDFRKKCKDNFKKEFNCEVHRLKDKKLKEIFGAEQTFKNNFPTLYKLFKTL